MDMNKRGQFYLIAAIIIIIVLFGVYMTKNSATSDNKNTVYDLGKELKLETGSVYDYGVFKKDNLSGLINNWADQYANYSEGKNVDEWIIVYGDGNSIDAVGLKIQDTGTIGIGDLSRTHITNKGTIKVNETDITYTNDKVQIKFNDFTHDFDLKPGENFFFVIKSGGSSTSS